MSTNLSALNESAPSRRGRQQMQQTRERYSPPASSLLLLFLLLAILPRDELVQGEPSQQQRGNGQSNEVGQDFSSGSGLADGLATLNGYGRGAYTNAKRARGKMSAFMPMRGRKDGRDLVGVDSLRSAAISPASSAFYQQQQQQQQQQQPLPDSGSFVRELEPNDDASLARLISGGAAAASLGAPGGNYQRYYLRDNATPRQFYNQFQTASAQQQQLAGDDARHDVAPMRSNGGGGGGLRSASLEQAEPTASTNQIMQAKLRRAFHPMRGKKSLFDQWALFEGLAADAQLS